MIQVPAGKFIAGSQYEDTVRFQQQRREQAGPHGVVDIPDYANELPQRTLDLGEFYIDKYEVTNDRYRRCVEASRCKPPQSKQYNDPAYANHPVVGVSWENADMYCRWAGKRLPAEMEWEKAARGTDGRWWPWGNEWSETLLYGSKNPELPMSVGSIPTDTSPYGVMDMADNVSEWVSDWYDERYYAASPSRNPKGPATGDVKSKRSLGSAENHERDARTTKRFFAFPDIGLGFRCAANARSSGQL
jgi:formylglycine-generating enzyme required for sulfatase activity